MRRPSDDEEDSSGAPRANSYLTRQSPSELEWLWTLRNSTLLINQLKALRADLSDQCDASRAEGPVHPQTTTVPVGDASNTIDDPEDEGAVMEALLATLAEEDDDECTQRQQPDEELGASERPRRLGITEVTSDIVTQLLWNTIVRELQNINSEAIVQIRNADKASMNLARQDENGKPKCRTELGRQILAETNDGRCPAAAEVERRAAPSSTPEPSSGT